MRADVHALIRRRVHSAQRDAWLSWGLLLHSQPFRVDDGAKDGSALQTLELGLDRAES